MKILETPFYKGLNDVKSESRQSFFLYTGGRFIRVEKDNTLAERQKPLRVQLEYYTEYSPLGRENARALSLYDVKRAINNITQFLFEFATEMLSVFKEKEGCQFHRDVSTAVVMLCLREPPRSIDQLEHLLSRFLKISKTWKGHTSGLNEDRSLKYQERYLLIARYYIHSLIGLKCYASYGRVREECDDLLRVMHPDRSSKIMGGLPKSEVEIVVRYGRLLITIRKFLVEPCVQKQWSNLDRYACFQKTDEIPVAINDRMRQQMAEVDALVDDYADEFLDEADDAVECSCRYDHWEGGLYCMLDAQEECVARNEQARLAVRNHMASAYEKYEWLQIINSYYFNKAQNIMGRNSRSVNRTHIEQKTGIHQFVYYLVSQEEVKQDWELICELLATWKEKEWRMVQSGVVFEREIISEFLCWQKKHICWCSNVTFLTPVVAGKVFDKIIADMKSPRRKESYVRKPTEV